MSIFTNCPNIDAVKATLDSISDDIQRDREVIDSQIRARFNNMYARIPEADPTTADDMESAFHLWSNREFKKNFRDSQKKFRKAKRDACQRAGEMALGF